MSVNNDYNVFYQYQVSVSITLQIHNFNVFLFILKDQIYVKFIFFLLPFVEFVMISEILVLKELLKYCVFNLSA